MNIMLRVGLVAAAVVAAALLGYNYLVAPNVGGPQRLAEFTPTPQPTVTVNPSPLGELAVGAGRLVPGSYVITDVVPQDITITVPSGWESLAVPAMVWSAEDEKSTVALFTVTDLFADPCDPGQGYAGVGASVDALVEALDQVAGITVDSTSEVTVSGRAATLVEYSSTDPGCATGVEPLLGTTQPGAIDRPHPQTGGAFQRWYILDVDGQRLVIAASAPVGASQVRLDQVDAILESIQIDAP